MFIRQARPRARQRAEASLRGCPQADPDAVQTRRRSIQTISCGVALAVLGDAPARAATSPVEDIRAARDLLDSIPGARLSRVAAERPPTRVACVAPMPTDTG